MNSTKPIEVFQDSFRIANLMLHLHRLLENDGLQTEGHLVTQIRSVLGAEEGEELQLLLNPIFLGCIRELLSSGDEPKRLVSLYERRKIQTMVWQPRTRCQLAS
jgi:hypothetical protein